MLLRIGVQLKPSCVMLGKSLAEVPFSPQRQALASCQATCSRLQCAFRKPLPADVNQGCMPGWQRSATKPSAILSGNHQPPWTCTLVGPCTGSAHTGICVAPYDPVGHQQPGRSMLRHHQQDVSPASCGSCASTESASRSLCCRLQHVCTA